MLRKGTLLAQGHTVNWPDYKLQPGFSEPTFHATLSQHQNISKSMHTATNTYIVGPPSCFLHLCLTVHSLFIYQGLQVDDETEVFLGKFTFDMEKSEIQTFHLQVCLSLRMRVPREWNREGRLGRKAVLGTIHLSSQNDPPTAFPKVKIQILSNWGHPHFTCLYRVRAHGMRTSEEAGDSATGGPN